VGFHKNSLFHAPAIVSGLFRQYIQATYVVHLQKLGDWLPAASYLSALGVCVFLIALILRSKKYSIVRPHYWLESLYFAVLPIMAVAIYALGGGFSMDSRKAYVIWPFLMIAIAFFLQRMPSRIQTATLVLAVLLCPAFLLATHATTRIWSQTGTLFEAAHDKIRSEKIAGPYQFDWQPNAYAVWPDFEALCGFRFDTPWVVDIAVGLPIKTNATPTKLTFNRDLMIWEECQKNANASP
jgi:hypothetical protein